MAYPDEHDEIYLEPLQENYGWDGRGWSTDDYYADIRDKPGVKFLLATPKRLAADDLYAALEELAVLIQDGCRKFSTDPGWSAIQNANAALSKARSEPLPLQSEK